MKKIYLLLGISLIFYSCEKSKPSKPDEGLLNDNNYVNKWIYDEMSTYYLWNQNIPLISRLNFEEAPSDFFNALLYMKGQTGGDRFSWIQENYVDLLKSLSGVSSYDIGFEYVGYQESEGSNIIARVAYVKPNTHAETLGVKRGDSFSKVNGTQLTASNWGSLFSSASAKVTFVKSGMEEEKNITLAKNYNENPVYLDTIYNEGSNRIGYLVYNFFAADGGNDSKKYDLELNEVFGRFKTANITHLILDFRYNNGGSMNSATLLGSMITPQFSTNDIFTKLQYNSLVSSALIQEYGSDALVDKFRDKITISKTSSVPLNNAGNNLQELYILTGRWTASASELIINNLEPYMPNKIHLIGATTAGKNVGSISIYEENDPKNKWGMQPIVLRYTNKNGQADFEQGFKPDVADPDKWIKVDLGNKEEVLLSIALSKINGTYSPSASRFSTGGLQAIGSSIEQKAWANQVIVNLDKLNP